MNEWMKIAIDCAKQAMLEDEFPVGAIVVKDQVMIGSGYNRKESTHSPIAHAEILAIQDASNTIGDWRLNDTILFTTLEPCPMCLGAIIQARIKKVVFAAKDIRWGACGSIMNFSNHPQLNHHVECEFCPNEDVVKMMKAFFSEKRG